MEERKPFLQESGEEEPKQYHKSTRNSLSRTMLLAISSVALSAAAISFLFWLIVQYRTSIQAFQERPGFLRKALRSKESMFYGNTISPYVGEPWPYHDDAWTALINNTHISISREELVESAPQLVEEENLVTFEDGSYMVWLEMWHEVHCLRWLRQAAYSSIYEDKVARKSSDDMNDHTDHCINHLLQVTLCHANSDVKLFKWYEGQTKPVASNNYATPRQCVDLELLQETLEDRLVPDEVIRRLQNPRG